MSIAEFQEYYYNIKSKNFKQDSEITNEIDRRIFQSLNEFLCSKFYETASIFHKFDNYAIWRFCQESNFQQFEENQKIFAKGEKCNSYYFILYGDINLYDQDSESEYKNFENRNNKLMKTISAGSVYGHKIKSNFNFMAIAKNTTYLIKIQKNSFDTIIDETNIRKDENKLIFLKKFFPKLRIYSDDVLNPLKPYFVREEHFKGNKILVDAEYDEYVYLVINGTLGVAKSIKKIKNLKEKILYSIHGYEKSPPTSYNYVENSDRDNFHLKYVILEKFSKGDIFGAYSALKHQKNNYTVIVLSEKAEIYKLSKAHCLFYFGGSSGILPEALRGIDTSQQSSLNYKLDFLENYHNPLAISKFLFLPEENGSSIIPKKIIDESNIENNLKNAWKELENLGSKISQFKDTLLSKNSGSISNKQKDLFSKTKVSTNDVELTDHSKVMGFATTRVVGKNLNKNSLTATQLKGMSTLQNICGLRKTSDKETDNLMLKKLSSFGESSKKNKILDNFDGEENNQKDEENINNTNRLNLANKFKKFKSCDAIETNFIKEDDVIMQTEEKKLEIDSDDKQQNKYMNINPNVNNSEDGMNVVDIPSLKQENPQITSVTNNNSTKNSRKISLKNLL